MMTIFLAQIGRQVAIATEFGEVNNLGEYISAILRWLVPAIGGFATLMLIFAGYIYLTSQGNPDAVSRAKDIIIGVIVGILLLFLMELLLTNVIGIPSG